MLNLRSKKLTWALLAATFATMLAMRAFDGYLTNETCENGIISFELAKTLDCSQAILDSWDSRAKMAASMSMGLDYLFLLVYSSTMALLLFRASEFFKKNMLLHQMGRILIWAVFTAAFFDGIENFALIKLLLGNVAQSWVTIAYAFAVVKFVLIGAAMLYLLPCLLFMAFGKK